MVEVGAQLHGELGDLVGLHAGLGVHDLRVGVAAEPPVGDVQPLGHLELAGVGADELRRVVRRLRRRHVQGVGALADDERRAGRAELVHDEAEERLGDAERDLPGVVMGAVPPATGEGQ